MSASDGAEEGQNSASDLSALQPFYQGGHVPAEEQKLWARLSASKRERALRRLWAVSEWLDRPSIHASASAAARSAGLSVRHFLELADAWEEKRTLAALGLHARLPQRSNARSGDQVRHGAMELLRQLLTQESQLGTIEAVRRVQENAEGERPSKTTVLRWIAEARRELSRQGEFGDRLLADSVFLEAAHPNGQRMRLYALADLGTRLLVGWSFSGWGHAVPAYVLAAADARRRDWPSQLSGLRSAPRPQVRFMLRSEDGMGVPMLAKRLRTEWPSEFVSDDARVGRDLLQLLGDRLGPSWIGAGFVAADRNHRNGRPAELPVWSAVLRAQFDEAVEQYNRRILSGLEREEAHDGSLVFEGVDRLLSCIDVSTHVDPDGAGFGRFDVDDPEFVFL